MHFAEHAAALEKEGFAIVPPIYTEAEISAISDLIAAAGQQHPAFLRSRDLFAIRQLLGELPGLQPLLFTSALKALVQALAGPGYFLTKAIYFDKPATSNWFVPYHQDLSISVAARQDTVGYSRWTHKRGQIGVHPPLKILQHTLTLRIHLDDTDADNGALRVIPGSHQKGEYRAAEIDWSQEKEVTCPVRAGGVMLMRPLTLHASRRSQNRHRRRVIHLEICNQELAGKLSWKEKRTI